MRDCAANAASKGAGSATTTAFGSASPLLGPISRSQASRLDLALYARQYAGRAS